MPNSRLREEVEREIAEFEALIANRKKMLSLLDSQPSIPTGEVEAWEPPPGAKTIDIVISYLQFKGGEVHVEDIFKALRKKGVNTGAGRTPKGKISEAKMFGNLKTSLKWNPKRVSYDPKTGIVKLPRK